VIEDTIHIEDSVGTLEDHNPAQVGEAEEEINLEDKRDQRHGQESSTLFVEGVNLAEI
jgi:hypothetical protein